MQYSAYVAVDNLSKAPQTATYVEPASCAASKDNEAFCQEFKDRLIDVKNQISAKTSIVGGKVSYHTFRMYSSSPGVMLDSQIALIRPGEKILDLTTGKEIEHPIRKPGECDPLKNLGTPCVVRGESWESVLKNNPIMVLAIADVETITPVFMGKTFTIQAMQMGIWRGRPVAKGVDGPTEPPLPTHTSTNTPTSTNTLTPTSTHTVTPTHTSTSTNTNTPTLTNTATVTNTPTNTATITNTPTLTSTNSPCPTQDCSFGGTNTTGSWNNSTCSCECYSADTLQYCQAINPRYRPTEDNGGCACICDVQELVNHCGGYDYDYSRCDCNPTPTPSPTETPDDGTPQGGEEGRNCEWYQDYICPYMSLTDEDDYPVDTTCQLASLPPPPGSLCPDRPGYVLFPGSPSSQGFSYLACGCGSPPDSNTCQAKCVGGPYDGTPCTHGQDCVDVACCNNCRPGSTLRPCSEFIGVKCKGACP